ncbi:glycosyltransferase family 2 protein [Vagococcus fluvialis]|uniref:Glycosyltransferase n=1 Tax=Vagococcus fluvialis TaxID=2738 RepID=A0A369B232_9ENTE|nr:glycosyltransferase family 2 protein [Vagococcus fluvialis]MBO0436859.1 glycosyltransferase family 2 protein [Vagococcus fluvialis]MBO0479639.1 glycosyltransferase family 2 protein [Vagococcus fluvialis]MBO0485393.1 glycosyltransferase family 2 protein [Vagococcus fluvialis]MDT2782705.1 glycosyltransferase family 2 protein [Vagococcus fluvialis]RCX15710.1 glycosyltransferase involved in cell wall biosynthesis [Vagococcus fluvialis]
MTLLSIVVPCYNEEETILSFYQEVMKIKEQMPPLNFEFIFVNDGSSDNTLKQLKILENKDPKQVKYLSFSRNFGKEAALYAGLKHATGDLITVMDADLQDPPSLLPEMYRLITEQNYDCIGTRRKNREGEPKIRSFFAKKFYKIINKISDVQIVDGARDFRLMTRQMVDAILELQEYNRFSKGLFSWVGFDTFYLEYENVERQEGKSSWSFGQLFMYSLDGIIAFSEFPLIISAVVGMLSFILAIIALIFIVVRALIFGDPTSGWPSLVCIILALGGLQLFCLGILGQYLGKTFLETKKRPIYILKEKSDSLTN